MNVRPGRSRSAHNAIRMTPHDMTATTTPAWTLPVSEDKVDADGFISLWNAVSEASEGDLTKTRDLCSRLLGFLCKHRCDFIVVSSTDAEYLDAWFERDKKLLYDWKPESETVDVLSQHAEVPLSALQMFIQSRKFQPEGNYSPRRVDRVEWFSEMWNVG